VSERCWGPRRSREELRLRDLLDLHSLLDECDGIIYNTNMKRCHVVIDTSVLVAALQARRGASYKLLMLVGSGEFDVHVSIPLVLAYEDAAKRLLEKIPTTERGIDDILDYVCAAAQRQQVFYLWRPFLRDLKADMVLELAVTSQCDLIVTDDEKGFSGVEQFGLRVVTPKEFLEEIGELP
jgi:putative PIN family toxin of toxin-antitoxin system